MTFSSSTQDFGELFQQFDAAVDWDTKYNIHMCPGYAIMEVFKDLDLDLTKAFSIYKIWEELGLINFEVNLKEGFDPETITYTLIKK
jgi:hypothetical protein